MTERDEADAVDLGDRLEIVEMAGHLSKGVPFATPVFDGAKEAEIRGMLALAYPDDIAKAKGLTATRS